MSTLCVEAWVRVSTLRLGLGKCGGWDRVLLSVGKTSGAWQWWGERGVTPMIVLPASAGGRRIEAGVIGKCCGLATQQLPAR